MTDPIPAPGDTLPEAPVGPDDPALEPAVDDDGSTAPEETEP